MSCRDSESMPILPRDEETQDIEKSQNEDEMQDMEKSQKNEKSDDECCLCISFILLLMLCLSLLIFSGSIERTVLSFELVCKTTNAYELQQAFENIDASSSENKSSDIATYLLQPSIQDLYFSARTLVKKGLSEKWYVYYENLAAQTTYEFFQMNLRSIANNTLQDEGHESNMQYIVVKSLVAVEGEVLSIPSINTFEDVIRSLRAIRFISYQQLLAEDLFWSHPLNNITYIPSLDLIVRPQLELSNNIANFQFIATS